MPFFELLRGEATPNLRRIIVMAIISGLSNALVLTLINSAAASVSQKAANGRLGLAFITVVIIFTISQRYIMVMASKEMERIIHRIRTRLIREVQHCELPDIERIGRTRIFNGVSKEIQVLAQSSNMLVLTCQMSVVVVFATIYLMTVSMLSFFLAAGFITVATIIYFQRTRRVNAAIRDAFAAEYGLHELLTGVLNGFKEIKLNSRRGDEAIEDIVEVSLDAATERVRAQVELSRNFVFVQDLFFVLLGTMVFIVPMLTDTYSGAIVKTTTAVLFLIGPISGVVSSAPNLVNANTSAANIMELERLLSVHAANGKISPPVPPLAGFKTIEFRNVTFKFDGQQGDDVFHVGPFNLTLRAGETVFISGGNGSGKSTFLRLLTTLYWPDTGTILVDGVPVTRTNVAAYRALFCAVFSEYYLSKRLYGIAPDALAEVPELLCFFEIQDKTAILGREFSTIELSAGQRKRLALIVALLEHRPVAVLDEWTADQDPVFRRKFYVEILPMMKARGITIIAVSHDDRYYDCADRRLHMEEGHFVSDTVGLSHV